ncbi:hypothetical protein [Halomicrococcus sp. SG-WS-1]|uniref:hypothetical protein n=1 Tax=Halomicrococcus sp. SG-WS-1 TaxID=3439057 RepID=UPI003F79AB6B
MTETESIETQRTPGNSRNLEPESSPDVRPDGSLATDSGSNVNEHEKTNSGKIWWWMSHRAAATGRFAFWIVKGTAYIALVTVVAVAVLDFVFGLSILF